MLYKMIQNKLLALLTLTVYSEFSKQSNNRVTIEFGRSAVQIHEVVLATRGSSLWRAFCETLHNLWHTQRVGLVVEITKD